MYYATLKHLADSGSVGALNVRSCKETLQRLVIVGHVDHHWHNGRYHAYAAYAREIEIWADLFPEVVIAAPCLETEPCGDTAPIDRDNVTMYPITELPGGSIGARLLAARCLPLLFWKLARLLRRADAVHVRLPGNLGMAGMIVAPLVCRNVVAKYTGQWNGFPGEAKSWKLQRWLLRSWWWPGIVTVYGPTLTKSPKVVSFFTSIMTRDQMELAAQSAQNRILADVPRILFVGRLSAAKNVDTLIRAVAALRDQNIPLRLRVVGNGPERQRLTQLADDLNLGSSIEFTGGVSFEQVLDCYRDSDVLVLASQTESWGKSITEAMAFGLVCIGSKRGLMPWMLDEGRGYVVEPRDESALQSALVEIVSDPDRYRRVSRRAAAWSQQYSLDDMNVQLRRCLETHWNVRLAGQQQ